MDKIANADKKLCLSVRRENDIKEGKYWCNALKRFTIFDLQKI